MLRKSAPRSPALEDEAGIAETCAINFRSMATGVNTIARMNSPRRSRPGSPERRGAAWCRPLDDILRDVLALAVWLRALRPAILHRVRGRLPVRYVSADLGGSSTATTCSTAGSPNNARSSATAITAFPGTKIGRTSGVTQALACWRPARVPLSARSFGCRPPPASQARRPRRGCMPVRLSRPLHCRYHGREEGLRRMGRRGENMSMPFRDDELEISFYKSRGPGGQKKNVTESAVRVRHIPTGIVVTATESRSQHRNKAAALEELERRLLSAGCRKPRAATKPLLRCAGGASHKAQAAGSEPAARRKGRLIMRNRAPWAR